jgi:hypothetical protein
MSSRGCVLKKNRNNTVDRYIYIYICPYCPTILQVSEPKDYLLHLFDHHVTLTKAYFTCPGVQCHLYLRQKYISSWLYRSAQPSLSTNYAFYRNSNPHSGAASVATLAVYWNNTKNFLLFSFRVVFFEHNTLVQDVSARGCVQIILKRSSFSFGKRLN